MTLKSSSYHPARRKVNGVLIGFLAIAAFFLVMEHRAHLLGILPYLLLLACPLMHLFLHRGHGGHGPEEGGQRHPHRPDRDSARENNP